MVVGKKDLWKFHPVNGRHWIGRLISFYGWEILQDKTTFCFLFRKSFEFEDIQGYRNRIAALEYQKLQEELNDTAGVRLYCTQSEDNLYEDIIGKFK